MGHPLAPRAENLLRIGPVLHGQQDRGGKSQARRAGRTGQRRPAVPLGSPVLGNPLCARPDGAPLLVEIFRPCLAGDGRAKR